MDIPCPFYEHFHQAETWDAIDEAIMACRDRHRAEAGDIPPEEEQQTKTTEMGIADAGTLVMPCLYCGAVTVLDGGICEKCADRGVESVLAAPVTGWLPRGLAILEPASPRAGEQRS